MSRPRGWHAVLAWLLAMAALAGASPLWREADWSLLARQLRHQAPPLQAELLLLDVPYDDELGRFRQRLLDVLQPLGDPARAPRALVLDVQFVDDPRLQPELIAALGRLRAQRTKVFAVVDPTDGPRLDPRYMARHARPLYEQALDGQGHTLFEHAAGLAKYDPLLDLGDGQKLPALAVQVAEQLFNRPADADTRPVVLRLGDASALRGRVLHYDPGTRALAAAEGGAAPDTRDRIVLLGSLAHDRPLAGGASGPEHLLWALSARGLPPEQAESRLAASPALLVVLVLAGGALAGALARAAYALFPRTHSRPGLIALGAGGVPLALLALASWGLAAAGVLLPQVTLPALGALLAAGLAGWFVRRHLAWASLQPVPVPMAEEHDVFVSYSRTDPAHVDWVRTQVVEPLRRARKPDGRPFEVFFDTEALRPGDAWLQRLYHAIDASRFFVPVYSADYFDKDFCQREIAHALRHQRPGRVYMVPVDQALEAIPSPYDAIQALRADAGQVAPRLVEAMQRALQADAAAEAARRVNGSPAGSGSAGTA